MPKLIRDDLAHIPYNNRLVGIATPELTQLLARHKLLEESNEIINATTTDQLTEELADLQEVIMLVMELNNLDPTIVERCRREKKQQRGGFDRHYFLI